jgi:predicted RND superfamily exporter protein
MQRSYIVAAAYALLAVSFVLLLDFQSFRCMCLALMPVGLGLIQLFGIMGWLNVPLNPANMIVLPLILGIGIDDGVHVVHDYRRQQGRYKLSASTATAVLITSLTTMMGFGSLMLAGHRGLQSLGRVLTIGVCCCLFTSIILLPALLAWFTRNRTDAESVESVEPRETAAPRTSPALRRVDEPHDRSEAAPPAPATPRRTRPRRPVGDPRRP